MQMELVEMNDSIVTQSATDSNSTEERIEVLDMVILNERFVRAKCRVRVGPIVIGDVKIIHPTLGQPFVQMPTRKVGEEWVPLVNVLSPTLKSAIDDEVLNAWFETAKRIRQ